jgi:hypothetical protein
VEEGRIVGCDGERKERHCLERADKAPSIGARDSKSKKVLQ